MNTKRDILMVVVALISGLIGGVIATSSKVIRAEKFELVDSQGRIQADINRGADGTVGLGVYDKNGQPRSFLGVTGEGIATLAFADDKGQPHIKVGVAPDTGIALLAFSDASGKNLLQLVIKPDVYTGLVLSDKEGKKRAELALESDQPMLAFLDKNEKPRVGWSLDGEGTSLINFWDENGMSRIGLGIHLPENLTHLSFNDGDQKLRLTLGLGPDGKPRLAVIDENKKITWKAP